MRVSNICTIITNNWDLLMSSTNIFMAFRTNYRSFIFTAHNMTTMSLVTCSGWGFCSFLFLWYWNRNQLLHQRQQVLAARNILQSVLIIQHPAIDCCDVEHVEKHVKRPTSTCATCWIHPNHWIEAIDTTYCTSGFSFPDSGIITDGWVWSDDRRKTT